MSKKHQIVQGQRTQIRLRLLVSGPAKSGKTYTGLRCARALMKAYNIDRLGIIEAGEYNNTEKYHGELIDDWPADFGLIKLTDSFAPDEYASALDTFEDADYKLVLIDSLSHEWTGKGGTLQIADKPSQLFGGWKVATPQHDALFETINRSNMHIIACVRAKSDYVVQANEKGKMEPVKIGLGLIQRDTAEFEFDIHLRMNPLHVGTVDGSRCRAVDGQEFVKPGPEFMAPVISWLQTGVQAPPSKRIVHITDAQVERILELLGEAAMPMEKLLAGFPDRFGVVSLERLTKDQADWVVNDLSERAASERRRREKQEAKAKESQGRVEKAADNLVKEIEESTTRIQQQATVPTLSPTAPPQTNGETKPPVVPTAQPPVRASLTPEMSDSLKMLQQALFKAAKLTDAPAKKKIEAWRSCCLKQTGIDNVPDMPSDVPRSSSRRWPSVST